MIRSYFGAFAALFIAAASTVSAHTIWIEPKDGQLVVRFAEPGTAFEKSPGYLDSLSPPVTFMVVTNSPKRADAQKKADHFVIAGTTVTNVAGVETTFTVRGGRKPIFYARWQPENGGASTPLLTLDLVPTGKPGEVRAYFRGKPLPNAVATLRGPDEKDHEITADAEGFLHFDAKEPGQYLLTIPHYREPQPLPGFYGGVAYKEDSHNAALTWVQAR